MKLRRGHLLACVAAITLLALVLTAIVLVHRRAITCLVLNDGTRAYFSSDTRVIPAPGFPSARILNVDGELLITTRASVDPLIVNAGLLTLSVTGESALRVVAYSNQPGAQVEVLSGHVVARKAYRSDQNEPDVLGAGEMSMVNRTIDLMEKEKCDLSKLQAWAHERVRAARE